MHNETMIHHDVLKKQYIPSSNLQYTFV